MKKFSTAALVLALGATLAPLRQTVAAPACTFLPNAPDQHLVVKGDTLWDISGKFLEHAWCWPQVWGMNREQIRNPHWIYPGQIVYFDRAAGRLRLGKPAGDTTAEVRLSPQIRSQGLGTAAIPSIPAGEIEPFLSQPLIVEETELAAAPHVVATQEDRVNIGKNDRAYVRGDLKGATAFQVFRPGQPLKDPDTGAVLGYEAAYLGTVKLVRAGTTPDEASTVLVQSSKQEIGVGDRLVPLPSTPIVNYMPHVPEKPVDGRVVSIYGGVNNAGRNQIITLNRGHADGLDVGTVLQLYRLGRVVADRTDGNKPVKLPDEQYGEVFVFRIFNHLSYALIMNVTEAVQVGDVLKSPE